MQMKRVVTMMITNPQDFNHKIGFIEDEFHACFFGLNI